MAFRKLIEIEYDDATQEYKGKTFETDAIQELNIISLLVNSFRERANTDSKKKVAEKLLKGAFEGREFSLSAEGKLSVSTPKKHEDNAIQS